MGAEWKKKIIMLLFGLFGAVILVGCGERQESQEEEDETQIITLMAAQNWIKDVDRQLFREFQEETGIEVKVLLAPDNGYETLLGTCLSGGNESIDIFMAVAGSWAVSAELPDVALDLSDEPWVPNLEDWARKANSVDGKVIGFSTWSIDYEGILYNRTLFEEYGLEVPQTWDDFIKLCEQLHHLGVTPLYESINTVWHSKSWIYGLTPALYQEDPDFLKKLNEGKEYQLGDMKAFRKGLKQLQELFGTRNGSTPRYYMTDGLEDDFPGSYDALIHRQAAMMFTYSAYAKELKERGSEDEWGMFPVPLLDNQTAVSNGGGVSKYINRHSSHKEECKAFFRFLARKENLEKYYAARADLVTAAFKEVNLVHPAEATEEILERSKGQPPVMFLNDIKYFPPDIYLYMQGLADGEYTVDQITEYCDSYRGKMLEEETKDTNKEENGT
ncbi:MAG: ABC transporter substrate-binding protein [Hominisplanchenecus sp.]